MSGRPENPLPSDLVHLTARSFASDALKEMFAGVDEWERNRLIRGFENAVSQLREVDYKTSLRERANLAQILGVDPRSERVDTYDPRILLIPFRNGKYIDTQAINTTLDNVTLPSITKRTYRECLEHIEEFGDQSLVHVLLTPRMSLYLEPDEGFASGRRVLATRVNTVSELRSIISSPNIILYGKLEDAGDGISGYRIRSVADPDKLNELRQSLADWDAIPSLPAVD